MALILLVGASLFVRSFLNLQSASPGFDTGAAAHGALLHDRARAYATDDQKAQRVDDIVRRIEALPGVASCVRVELRSARRRRRQRPCDRRRPRRARRRRADHPLHRGDAPSLQDDGTAAPQGPRLHRCGRRRTHAGRGDQRDDGEEAVAGDRRRRAALPPRRDRACGVVHGHRRRARHPHVRHGRRQPPDCRSRTCRIVSPALRTSA